MADSAPPSASSTWLRWGLVGLIVVAAAFAFRQLPVQSLLQTALDRIAGLGFWGPIIFVLAYLLASVFLIPGSVLTLGAGAVFGLGWGLIWVTLGANLGAQAAFLVGRHIARDWVARKIENRPAFRAIDEAVAAEGWKIVVLTRLSPAFPFTLLNYALGLTRVRFTHYALATFFGMLPGTVLYVYLGALARAGVQSEGRTPMQWAALILGLLATLAVTILVARIALRALKERVRLPAGPPIP